MTNTALTGATYDIDGGQQLVAKLKRQLIHLCYRIRWEAAWQK